jgi:hypothetical protein
MKYRLLGLLIAIVVAAAVLIAPFSTAQAQSATTFPVTGTGTTAAGDAVNFVGTFSIQKFTAQGGAVEAVGTLSGTVTDAATGAVLGTVTNLRTTIDLITGSATGDCQILHLELGPLDLDLLGLVVHLDRIVLDITAVPGAGNLLGNLLCAVAGLLDNNAPLNIIADLLNSILDVLNWLG